MDGAILNVPMPLSDRTLAAAIFDALGLAGGEITVEPLCEQPDSPLAPLENATATHRFTAERPHAPLRIQALAVLKDDAALTMSRLSIYALRLAAAKAAGRYDGSTDLIRVNDLAAD